MIETPHYVTHCQSGVQSDIGRDIPATGLIGRSIFEKSCSMLSFLNPFFNVDTGKLEEESLAAKIYRQEGAIRILNLGCGGCADIPLLQELLEKAVDHPKDKISAIEIVNLDLSELVLQAVRDGKFPYYECFGHGENLLPEIQDLANGDDETYGNVDPLELKNIVDGAIARYFVPVKRPISTKSLKSEIDDCYLMIEEERKQLVLELGDARQLPFPSYSFDIVLAHALFDHFNMDSKTRARNEMVRVTKRGGFLFPDYAIYQKRQSKVIRISGFANDHREPESGLLCTRNESDQHPFALDRWYRSGGYPERKGIPERLNYDRIFIGRMKQN